MIVALPANVQPKTLLEHLQERVHAMSIHLRVPFSERGMDFGRAQRDVFFNGSYGNAQVLRDLLVGAVVKHPHGKCDPALRRQRLNGARKKTFNDIIS